jgi:hypothetical protein
VAGVAGETVLLVLYVLVRVLVMVLVLEMVVTELSWSVFSLAADAPSHSGPSHDDHEHVARSPSREGRVEAEEEAEVAVVFCVSVISVVVVFKVEL